MKLLMTCLFLGLFFSCAHSTKNEASTDQDKAEKKADTKTESVKTKPSNGGLDL